MAERVKRVDYGRGSDFWLPCLGALERYIAGVMLTSSPMTLLPTPVLKAFVDTTFQLWYPDNHAQRLDDFITIMEIVVVTTIIDETPVEFYYTGSQFAVNIAIARLEGATSPTDYDCMCLSYQKGYDTNPI